MKDLTEFTNITKRLIEILEKGLPIENLDRDKHIQSINELLDKRELLLVNLPNIAAMLDSNLKRELIDTEKKINTLMLSQKNLIKKDLQVLQLKKKKSNQYVNPYRNVSIDGMFLDKKK